MSANERENIKLIVQAIKEIVGDTASAVAQLSQEIARNNDAQISEAMDNEDNKTKGPDGPSIG